MTTDRDAPTIVVEREITAPPAATWRALTRPAEISRWLTRCERTAPGTYALTFEEEDGCRVKTAVLRSGHRTASARGFAVTLHDPGYSNSVVSFDLVVSGHGSAVRLAHTDAPPGLCDGYRTGWADFLDQLVRHVEAGSPAGRP